MTMMINDDILDVKIHVRQKQRSFLGCTLSAWDGGAESFTVILLPASGVPRLI